MKAEKLNYQFVEYLNDTRIYTPRKVYRFKCKKYAGKAFSLYLFFLSLRIDVNPNVFGCYIRFKNESDCVSVETTFYENEAKFLSDLEFRLGRRKLKKDSKSEREAVKNFYSKI